jgi:hypothetical protein
MSFPVHIFKSYYSCNTFDFDTVDISQIQVSLHFFLASIQTLNT